MSKIHQFYQIDSHKWPPGDTLESLITIYGANDICRYHDTINEHHVLESMHSCVSAMSGSESVPPSIFKSIGNETDEGSCKDDCERRAVSSSFQSFVDGLDREKTSTGQEHTEREHKDIEKGTL